MEQEVVTNDRQQSTHSIETIKSIYTIPCGAYSATQYQYAAGRSIFIITLRAYAMASFAHRGLRSHHSPLDNRQSYF